MRIFLKKGPNKAGNKKLYTVTVLLLATGCLAYLHETGAAPDPWYVILVKASYMNDFNINEVLPFYVLAKRFLFLELCRYFLSG